MSTAGHATLGCRQAVRHQTLTLAFVGSNPAIPANDPLAQLAEQLPFKQWVRSSNLRRVTKIQGYPFGYPCIFMESEEIRKSKMQQSGGLLLPPVQTLVATLISALTGRNANESPAGHRETPQKPVFSGCFSNYFTLNINSHFDLLIICYSLFNTRLSLSRGMPLWALKNACWTPFNSN